MTKYEEMVSKIMPDPDMIPWLKSRGKYGDHAMIYRTEWVSDWMTGLKSRSVRCTCGACGGSYYADYIKGGSCVFSRAPYGFWDDQSMREVCSWDTYRCEMCGESVRLLCYSTIGEEAKISEVEAHELRVIRGMPVFLKWCVQRVVDKSGAEIDRQMLDKAFVVEENKVVRLNGEGGYFYGRFHRVPRETKRMTDDFGAVAELLPFDWSSLEGTVLENAKLKELMKIKGLKAPVSYVRLYLKKPHVENLISAGLGDVLVGLIYDELTGGMYGNYGGPNKILTLPALNLRSKRPGEMLGMDREEIRNARAERWAWSDMVIYGMIKRESGQRMPRELLPTGYRDARMLLDMGDNPVRTARYLRKQGETISYLNDYREMAMSAGKDLTKEVTRFPTNLKKAHDEVKKLQKYLENAHLREKFLKREKALRIFAFEREGILIRPVANERELIDEGEALEHCVARYAESYCKKQASIMLIRRIEAPEKPWYTLNLDEKSLRVIENRGFGNCNPTEEVQVFVEAWLEFLQKSKGA